MQGALKGIKNDCITSVYFNICCDGRGNKNNKHLTDKCPTLMYFMWNRYLIILYYRGMYKLRLPCTN